MTGATALLLPCLLFAAVLPARAESVSRGDWQLRFAESKVQLHSAFGSVELMPVSLDISPPLPAKGADTFAWNPESGTLVRSYERGKVKITETVALSAPGSTPRAERTVELVAAEGVFLLREVAFPWAVKDSGNYLFPASDKGNGQLFDADASGALGKLRNGGSVSGRSEGFAPLLIERDGKTLLFLSAGRDDVPGVTIEKFSGIAIVRQLFQTRGWLEAGKPQTVAGASADLWNGALEEALLRAPARYFRDKGITPMTKRRDDLRDTVIYSAHPGGTIKGDTRELGGFRAAERELIPILADYGFNRLWLLPLEDQSVYHPRDYRKFQQGLGDGSDYLAMLDACRRSGIRVWRDIVPHGNSPAAAAFRGNSPFLLLFNEKGGVDGYWCFDFANPGWQKYMAGIAEEYVRNGNLDGLRIDAVKGSRRANYRRENFPAPDRVPPGIGNESFWHDAVAATGGIVPPLEYARGGLTLRRGGLEMAAAIRAAAEKANPEAVTLAETNEGPFVQAADVIYDSYFASFTILRLRFDRVESFARGAMRRMHEQACLDPAGTIRLRYIENHDTTSMLGYFGPGILKALWTLEFAIPGIPLINQDNEILNGVYLKKLIELRKAVPELRRGDADYTPLAGVPECVFTVGRRLDSGCSTVLINFSRDPREFPAPAGGVELFSGKTVVPGETLRLEPFAGALIRQGGGISVRPLLPAAALETAKTAEGGAVSIQESGGKLVIEGIGGKAVFNPATGLPEEITGIPVDFTPDAKPREVKLRGNTLTVTLENDATLRWIFQPGKIELDASGAAFHFGVTGVKRFQIHTLGGVLDDYFYTRHAAGRAGVLAGSDYRPRGTPVVWSHELFPLSPIVPEIEAGGDAGTLRFRVNGLTVEPPNRLEVRDRRAENRRFHLYAEGRRICLEITPERTPMQYRAAPDPAYVTASGVKLNSDGLDYIVETASFKVELRRNGGILQKIWKRDAAGGWRLLCRNSRFYTNRGFGRQGEPADRYGSMGCDPESGVAISERDGVLELRFTGRFRDDGRWQSIRPAVDGETIYRFGAEDSFEMEAGFLSKAKPLFPDRAYLALTFTLEPGAARDLTIRRVSESGPEAKEVNGELVFALLDGKADDFVPNRWHRLKLEVSVK